MAKLTRREREEIKSSIQNENILLQRVKRYVQYSFLVCLVCLVFLFTFLKDGPQGWRIFVIILAVISGLFAGASYLSYRNGRKHVLSNINYLDENKQ